jgi:hypothetical protein
MIEVLRGRIRIGASHMFWEWNFNVRERFNIVCLEVGELKG